MDPVQLIGPIVGLLCCCIFWAVVIAVVVYFMRGRGGDAATQATKAIEDKPDLSAQAAAANADKDRVVATPGADEEVDPEDAATVVAPPPPGAKKPPGAPAPEPPQAEAKPKPPPRTSGATIIAFDDDFDDE